MKRAVFLFLLFVSMMVNGQNEVGLELIESDLDAMGLEFYMPLENSFSFKKLRVSEFFDYDSRVRARSREMEVLIALHPEKDSAFAGLFPHLEFNRLLANLTPNDDDQDVLVIGWRKPKLLERNADWGAEAYFKPRKDITNFPFVKLIAFYKESRGMVVMLYCFDNPDEVPKLLSFEDSDMEEDGRL